MHRNDFVALSGLTRMTYDEAMDRRSLAWEAGDTEAVIALTNFACALSYAMLAMGLFTDNPRPVRIGVDP